MKAYRIFLLMIAACSIVACSQDDAGVSAPPHPDAKLIARAGAPLFDGMGSHHHSITSSIPGVQRYFDQGLIIDFAFNHAESVRSFRAAQRLDPNCAMCYWGEALALGPNINVTSARIQPGIFDSRVHGSQLPRYGLSHQGLERGGGPTGF